MGDRVWGHRQRRVKCPLRMVLMGPRRAEQGENSVTGRLRNVAAIAMYCFAAAWTAVRRMVTILGRRIEADPLFDARRRVPQSYDFERAPGPDGFRMLSGFERPAFPAVIRAQESRLGEKRAWW
jgi:hypothetical protein